VPDWVEVTEATTPAYRIIPDPPKPDSHTPRREKKKPRTDSRRPPKAAPATSDDQGVEFVPEENFFAVDDTAGSAESSTAEPEPPVRSDADIAEEPIEAPEIVAEENFFAVEESVETEPDVDAREGPTEMIEARADPSFESPEVVEAENFFAEGDADSVTQVVDAAPEQPAADDGATIDVVPEENFFAEDRQPPRRVIEGPARPKRPEPRGLTGMRRRISIAAIGVIMLLAGIYVVTLVIGLRISEDEIPRPQMTAVSPIAPPPLSDLQEARANEIKAQIARFEGARKARLQRDLITLYVTERRLDLAAVVQQEIAEGENTEVEWIRSGNLYYDWMETQTGATKTQYAKLAIASYERALDINPNNLDVRTDMAIAFLYDPEHPQEAIRNINMVLDQDPGHVQANFNRGIMLLSINRYDQALRQFDKVRELVGDPNSPIYQRAEAAIETVRAHLRTTS
jgi:hypothetical protein